MIRRKNTNNWDGYNECPYEWDGNERRQPQQIIVEQPIEKSTLDKIFAPNIIIPLLGGIMISVFSYSWNQHDQIKNMEFKIQQLSEQHTEHEKADVDFKEQYKDLAKKIDQLKDQLNGVEQTMMEVYRSANTKSHVKLN